MSQLLRKLFLVKEIVSRAGVLHFQRYRFIETKAFRVYLHRISASDEDKDMHDHPWSFRSLILKGSYTETWTTPPNWDNPQTRTVRPGDVVKHHHWDAHKLTLNTPVVWTLVLTGDKSHDWGYQTEQGWVDHRDYRAKKNEGRLDWLFALVPGGAIDDRYGSLRRNQGFDAPLKQGLQRLCFLPRGLLEHEVCMWTLSDLFER